MAPTLSEDYLLVEKDDKSDIVAKPVEETPVNVAASDEPADNEPAVQKSDETPVVESSKDGPAAPASDEPAAASNEPAAASDEPASDEPVVQKSDVTPVVDSTEDAPAAADGTGEASEASAEEASDAPDKESPNEASTTEESSEQETSGDQDAADKTEEFKLETAPADFRFPTTNQTRHCFTRYIEYHRCIAAKGEDAPECNKFAKYYRSLCPGEWVDRWNEQRENGTFPGPL